tara:strand:+ start:428 stop:571 length:144 start_codon:yes stop_codon:yes gene_type:complete
MLTLFDAACKEAQAKAQEAWFTPFRKCSRNYIDRFLSEFHQLAQQQS